MEPIYMEQIYMEPACMEPALSCLTQKYTVVESRFAVAITHPWSRVSGLSILYRPASQRGCAAHAADPVRISAGEVPTLHPLKISRHKERYVSLWARWILLGDG